MPGELKKMLGCARLIHNRCKGFTLTEVVVASLLLAAALIPILKALTVAHETDVKVEQRTRSLVLAQAKLDEIKAKSVYSWSDDFADPSSSVDGAYLCKVVESAVPGRLTLILKDFEVSVGYDDNNNSVLEATEIQVTLRTLVAKREP